LNGLDVLPLEHHHEGSTISEGAGVEGASSKLDEGGDGQGLMTVVEQVDRAIAAATSLDNLSRMYEGWTPWL
jgi:hypothetical protein